MKYLFTTFIFLFALTLSAQSFKSFRWLEGSWERQNTKQGSSAFENWEIDSKYGLKGQGLTLKGSDTVFVEKLSIVFKDQKYFYVAEVSHNAAPTYFEITQIGKNQFMCENPEHDFPKKIAYFLEGNKLTATISGNGKEIPFVFLKRPTQ